MRDIYFWKYQGCGNDFLLMDEVENLDYNKLAKNICNRNFGIGADGLILIKEDPLVMRILNNDGSEATMCGNGIRCFIKCCIDQKNYDERSYEIKTLAGIMRCNVVEKGTFQVQVDMGEPSFHQKETGVLYESAIKNYSFYMHHHIYLISTLFLGTIHTVLIVPDIDHKRWIKIGYEMHQHSFFTKKTNVNFVEIVDRHTIKVKTYEKGVGITLACGSGACASAYCAYQNKLCDASIHVVLAKGSLDIEIVDNNVLMRGSAQYIGKGIYLYEEE